MLSKNGCKLLSIDEQYIYLYNGMRRFPHAKGSEGPKGSNAQKVPIPKTTVQVSLAVANDIINLIEHY